MLVTSPTLVLIFDRHPLFRAGLTQAVKRVSPTAQVFDFDAVGDAQTTLHGPPNLVIIGRQPGVSPLAERVAAARAAHPQCRIICFADPTEAADAADIDAGRVDILPRRATLAEVARTVHNALPATPPPSPAQRASRRGLEALTPAQTRVLVGLMNGRLNKQIAHEMQISEATVKAHVTAVFRKLGVRNRTQAVIAARELSLAPVDA